MAKEFPRFWVNGMHQRKKKHLSSCASICLDLTALPLPPSLTHSLDSFEVNIVHNVWKLLFSFTIFRFWIKEFFVLFFILYRSRRRHSVVICWVYFILYTYLYIQYEDFCCCCSQSIASSKENEKTRVYMHNPHTI